MTSIADRLRETGLFEGLAEQEFDALCGSTERVEVAAGDVVVREGEPGNGLYVLEHGAVQVFTFGEDGGEIVLAKLGPGQHFGEQALVPGRPDRRNAHVRAFSKTKLLRVTKEAFQHALSLDSPLRDRLERLGEEQLRANLATQFQLFRSLQLESGEASLQPESFDAGTTIFRQGEFGDRVYFILSGTARVYQEAGGSPQLVVRLSMGQCFGELALLRRAPRSATVVAEGPLIALSLNGQRFLELHESTPELRDYMQTLQTVYVLPRRGFATQHTGRFMGSNAITTMYHLADGRRMLASRVVGGDTYNMAVVGAGGTGPPRRIRYVDPETGDDRELALAADGQLAGATVCGVWEQLGQIHHMILEGRTLKPWQEDIFRARGTLRLEEDSTFFEDSEPICSCLHVTRGALDQCIREGCNTAAELTERTGAGSVCGACIPRLRELCGCAEWTPVTVTEQIRVSDTVRSFRLTPASGELVAPLPGQHVVVQARIGNDWVQRPYTLTSDCTECGSYQITVKREPRGLLSGWLFDRCDEQSLLRVSAPLGTFTLAMDSKAPGACFVGGIGVTPAVAMARSLAATGSPHRLHIDLSSSEPETLAYLTKIAEQAKAQGLTVSTRLTSEAGHVTREDVAAVARELPGAIFFICGPKGFQEHVEGLLRLLDVPADRVRVETFTPQGDRPTRPGPLAKPKQTIGHPALPQPPGRPPGPRPGDKPPVPEIPARQRGPIDEEARAYLQRFYYEKGVEKAFESRWREVEEEIERTGTYVQTYDELSFGAKLAWRNSGRCIGRLFWSGLQVRDRRHLTSEEAIFEEICEHLRLATNGGNLRAVMTVFAPRQPGQPAPRLWNPQLLRYAGYPQIDGSWIGDPANAELTEACLAIGWDPGERTHFDILPLVMQLPGREPKLFELPRELILEVSLTHPEFDWFQDLGLRWHAVPAIAEMLFDCGGIQYSLAPFNGWYMGTEIGARNLSDEFRYNRLPDIAERMGLDLTRERSLWRDRALVELNIAVLHSFERAGAKMVDHHTAGNEFMEFVEQEVAAGRRIDGRWSWLVPPMSGSQSKAWPIGWYDLSIKPAYQYQKAPYKAWLRAQRRAARENRSHSSSVASGGNVESAGTRE